MYQLSASIVEVSDWKELEIWLEKIPYKVNYRQLYRLRNAVKKGKTTILWTEHSGFRIFDEED
jgi:hypothetical protein